MASLSIYIRAAFWCVQTEQECRMLFWKRLSFWSATSHIFKSLAAFNICSSISLPKHEPCKAKDLVGQGQGLLLKAKAKDSKSVLEDTPRTKAKDNNTDSVLLLP